MSKSRGISLLTATGIVVSNMVGTGIFTTLGFQVGPLPSGFAILLLWLLGGLCAFCGAVAYGELAAALPRSGGEYHFLSHAYHPAVGFLAGWLSATVGFAAPVALAAMAFGQYFAGVFPELSALALSVGVVVLVTAVHLRGVGLGAVFQNVATILKVTLILVFIIAGIWSPSQSEVTFAPQAGDLDLVLSAPFAVSLVFVMYAYSGWNAATYIIGDIRDPARTVPRAIALGTLIVTGLYLALNATFLRAAPLESLAGQLDVGHVASAAIFGSQGGRLMAGLISLGLVASISAMTWIGPRVSMTMGEDHGLLAPLARLSARGVPVTAMLLQSAIVLVLLLSATFTQVLNTVQFSLTLCSMLAVAGVFVLRIRQPNLPRPYRTWGYPVTPLIFLAISTWMLVFLWREHFWESLFGFGTLLVGLALFFLSDKRPPSASV